MALPPTNVHEGVYLSIAETYNVSVTKDVIDCDARTFCEIPFQNCNTIDFRTRNGKAVRKRCPNTTVPQLRRMCALLHKTTQCETHSSPTEPPAVAIAASLASLPPVPPILCAAILGWWTRWQLLQKGALYHAPWKWANDDDPISLESLQTIPSRFVILLDIHAFDIRLLMQLFVRNICHPFLNSPFSESHRTHASGRWDRLQNRLRYQLPSISTTVCTATLTPPQRALSIFQKIDTMGYITDIGWYTQLTRKELCQWYQAAEDIWNYRAELTPAVKQTIAPGPIVFGHVLAMKTATDLPLIHARVLDAMERLVSSADDLEDRRLGAMYVLTALTECSVDARNAMPWMYNPPNM
jgi:hypothetical protein